MTSMLVHIYINIYARCLSFVLFAVCQRSSFLPSVLTCSKSKNRCARQCPSELGAALTGRFFRKASAKVRPFSELAKSFGNFFSRKSEKDGFWTKQSYKLGKMGQQKADFTPKSTLLHVTSYISHFTSHSMLHLSTLCNYFNSHN